MPAPSHGSIGTLLQGSAATANFPVPASVASGDLIVVAFFQDGDGTITGMPAGFAHAPSSPVNVIPESGGGRHSLNVLWKRADAADTGTYDFTLSVSTYRHGRAIRHTGAVASGDPWDNTASAYSGVNVSASPAVSVTTLGPDRLLLWFATNWSGGTWTPPTGFTERFDSGDGTASGADKAQATAGTSGSISGTCTGSDRAGAWLGALKPVSNDVSSGASIAATATITASGGATSSPSVAVSATITASGVVGKSATAEMSLSATMTAAAAGSNATATSALSIAFTATGVVDRRASASMALSVAVTTSGGGAIGSSANLAVGVAFTASGLVERSATSSLGMAVAITATGYKSSGGGTPTRWVRISGTWVIVP